MWLPCWRRYIAPVRPLQQSGRDDGIRTLARGRRMSPTLDWTSRVGHQNGRLEGLPCFQGLPLPGRVDLHRSRRRDEASLARNFGHPGSAVPHHVHAGRVLRTCSLWNGPCRSFSVNARCLSGGRGQKGYAKNWSRSGREPPSETLSKVVRFLGSQFPLFTGPNVYRIPPGGCVLPCRVFVKRSQNFPRRLGCTQESC